MGNKVDKQGGVPASGGGSSPVPIDRNIVGASDEEVDKYFEESPVFNVSGCIDL
jgi:hypothetical protein